MSARSHEILIRGVNWIGDAVLTLPALKSIRRNFPEAHISLLVKPWVSEIFRGNPDIDEIILYGDGYKGCAGKLRLARALRRRGFDKAILLQNAFDAALISWLAGIPERTGYKRDCRGMLLTNAVPVRKDVLRKHQVYYYLNLLESAGIRTVEAQPYIYLTGDEINQAERIISSSLPGPGRPLVGINPGAAYGPAKRWPSERFAGLIRRIIGELDARVIIFGSGSEAPIADEIIESAAVQPPDSAQGHDRPRILNMCGKTGLRELAALISGCDAFVTNDSGPMHMACALFVPVVAIFGSTDKAATGPFGPGHRVVSSNLPCSPCMKRECPERHLECMAGITVDEVFDALKAVLPRKRAVFLDRDGTIIEDKNYLNSFDGLEILPGAGEALSRLKDAEFMLIGVTNQSGIARGIVDNEFIIKSNEYLKDRLGMDDFLYCPHHPDERCPCRKPEPMMILRAGLMHGIRLRDSYVIGDKESDALLARRAGATGILLSPEQSPARTCAAHIAKGLNDAVEWILQREGK
ncbi:MAG: lipopolysaccharide heptosyltransferase II, partial [Deferribacteres bacterium]|nr:lipopolysaccharide heptosyltransferase II [Deferribacteres bacterium]